MIMRRLAWLAVALLAAAPVLAQDEDQYIGDRRDTLPLFGSGDAADDAAVNVWMSRYLVRQIAVWCVEHVPASAAAVRAAESTWLQQHASIHEHADAFFSRQGRNGPGWVAEETAKPGRERLAKLPKAQQAAWCRDKAPGRIASDWVRTFDDPEMRDPLAADFATRKSDRPIGVDVAQRAAHPPQYPASARAACAHGTVQLSMAIDDTGSILNVFVAQSSGNAELDAAAVEAAKRWTYLPGISGGTAFGGAVDVPVEFADPC